MRENAWAELKEKQLAGSKEFVGIELSNARREPFPHLRQCISVVTDLRTWNNGLYRVFSPHLVLHCRDCDLPSTLGVLFGNRRL